MLVHRVDVAEGGPATLLRPCIAGVRRTRIDQGQVLLSLFVGQVGVFGRAAASR